jgi:hypothetical protein
MKRLFFVAGLAIAALGLAVAPALASNAVVATGTGTATGAEDIGTCNQVWAEDTLTKTFMLFATGAPGTYSLEVKEHGSFVSNAGASPGACETGSPNGSTIPAGVTGMLTAQWDNTVHSLATPTTTPDCSNNACASSGGFLDAVFGPGNWTKDAWSWDAHYTAPGGHGAWFDTNVNWPLDDRGDIT